MPEKLEKPSILESTMFNNVLQHNTGKMYIAKIFNHLLVADRSSIEYNQVVDSDLPQDHTHLTIPSNRSSREV